MSNNYLGTEWFCDACGVRNLCHYRPHIHPIGWAELSVHVTADDKSTRYGSIGFTVCDKCNPHNSNTKPEVRPSTLRKLWHRIFPTSAEARKDEV